MTRPLELRDTDQDRAVLASVFRDQIYGRLPEAAGAAVRAAYERAAHPLIIDGGAYNGTSTVWFARSFPRAHVIAVEPDDENHQLLTRNTADEANVEALRGALVGAGQAGRRHGVVQGGDRGKWACSIHPTRVDIPGGAVGYDVDSLIGSRDPFILKIDIEGCEDHVFDDGVRRLDWPLVFIEIHDWLRPGLGLSRSFFKWHSRRARDLYCLDDGVLASVDLALFK